MMTSFGQEVLQGLQSEPKQLSSKWFYDEAGDTIFQQIMALPEYYLTRCEHQIMSDAPIPAALGELGTNYDIIELGAGDGYKTKVLLRRLLDLGIDIRYIPIDISSNVLQTLAENMKANLPGLSVEPQQGEYFEVLERLSQYTDRPKLILFMGSNIGNLLHPIAIDFLTKLGQAIQSQDRLLVGFDLKKDPATILAAYNDSAGVTASFNYNILKRINDTLGGNFDISQWQHVPVYNPESGTCKSYLMSLTDQSVHIDSLDKTIHFEAYETIHTEISQKYSHSVIRWLCGEASLEAVEYFTDDRGYFADYVIRKR